MIAHPFVPKSLGSVNLTNKQMIIHPFAISNVAKAARFPQRAPTDAQNAVDMSCNTKNSPFDLTCQYNLADALRRTMVSEADIEALIGLDDSAGTVVEAQDRAAGVVDCIVEFMRQKIVVSSLELATLKEFVLETPDPEISSSIRDWSNMHNMLLAPSMERDSQKTFDALLSLLQSDKWAEQTIRQGIPALRSQVVSRIVASRLPRSGQGNHLELMDFSLSIPWIVNLVREEFADHLDCAHNAVWGSINLPGMRYAERVHDDWTNRMSPQNDASITALWHFGHKVRQLIDPDLVQIRSLSEHEQMTAEISHLANLYSHFVHVEDHSSSLYPPPGDVLRVYAQQKALQTPEAHLLMYDCQFTRQELISDDFTMPYMQYARNTNMHVRAYLLNEWFTDIKRKNMGLQTERMRSEADTAVALEMTSIIQKGGKARTMVYMTLSCLVCTVLMRRRGSSSATPQPPREIDSPHTYPPTSYY